MCLQVDGAASRLFVGASTCTAPSGQLQWCIPVRPRQTSTTNPAGREHCTAPQKIGHDVMRLLRQIVKEQNRRVVIISHDRRSKEIADGVVWLEDGQFKEGAGHDLPQLCQNRLWAHTGIHN